MMNKIEQVLLSSISEHPKTPLVIAYSGGVDSQVLLHALASLKQQVLFSNAVSVCHVNHGLSEYAEQWQVFAENQCQQLNLPLTICQVNVKATVQQSLEALARDARYTALQSISTQTSLIITGHHSDDQAETFLLALKRGSGIKGLSAMTSVVKKGKDFIVRPLLHITRAQIVDYAKSHQLTWVEDESNSDSRFDRNFIRNDIMPLLIKRWPSITHTINRSSEHCREGQLLLDELAQQDLSLCRHELNSLTVASLRQLSTARFNNLIRYFLTQHQCLMPSTEQLIQLHQQLNANVDKNPSVKVGEHYFRRYKEAIFLTDDFKDVTDWQVVVELNADSIVIELPDYIGALNILVDKHESRDELNNSPSKTCLIAKPNESCLITLRFSHDNPTCQPDYRNHSRSVKKVLQELNIPPWQRKRIPFLYYDGVLVAALGYFVCQEFSVKRSLSNNDYLSFKINR